MISRHLQRCWTERIVLIIALLGAIAAAAIADSADLPGVWIPNPKLVAKLGLPVHFDEFSVQPPAGLEMTVHHSDQSGLDTYSWRQPKEDDRFGGFLLTAQNSTEATPSDAIDDWMISLGQATVDNLTHSDTQTGTINGASFARVFYKGLEHGGPRAIHGFVYITIAGTRMYVEESVDIEPRNADTLPIAEAAAMTLVIAPTESADTQ